MSLRYKRIVKQVPDNVDDLFSENQYITILGNAGTGKTMLLKHCFLSCLKYSHQIPIVIEFRNLNSYEGTILDYIKEFVFNMHIVQNERILERLLSFGRFAFLLDGFDEISLAIKDKRIRELEAFIDSYMHNNFLLTSRPEANAENLHRFENYRICKLNESEIELFVKMQTKRIEDGDTLEKRILELIKKRENSYYLSYISNPLLLSMFIFTFNNHPELPKRKSDFYFNVFDTLYSRHDTLSKHGGYTHDKKTSLERHDFEYILQLIKDKKKIVSVHSKDAENDVLALLLKYKIPNVIFHWYSGEIKYIADIISAGYYFSINEAMTRSKKGLNIISRIPRNRILTESDAPFNSRCSISKTIEILGLSEQEILFNWNQLLDKIR